jgi:hypothetical protein
MSRNSGQGVKNHRNPLGKTISIKAFIMSLQLPSTKNGGRGESFTNDGHESGKMDNMRMEYVGKLFDEGATPLQSQLPLKRHLAIDSPVPTQWIKSLMVPHSQ